MTHRNRSYVACGLAAIALIATVPAPSAGATDEQRRPPTTRFVPSKLDRGKTDAPYVRGNTIHDGKRTVKVRVPHDIWDVQRLRRGYLVETDDPKSGWGQILYRVGTGGKATKLRRFKGHVWSVNVDSRGRKVAVQIFRIKGYPLTVFDAFSNKVQRRTNVGSKEILNYIDGRLLLERGAGPSRLMWYDPRTDETEKIGKVRGWAVWADPALDLMALRADRGCFDVRRFERPRKKLWRLCAEHDGLQAGLWFSPNGKYVLTREDIHDPPKWQTVYVRRASDGKVVHRFRTHWFGAMGWEDNHTVTMEASARAKAALVRCTLGGKCKRVTNVVKGADDVYAIGKLDITLFDKPEI